MTLASLICAPILALGISSMPTANVTVDVETSMDVTVVAPETAQPQNPARRIHTKKKPGRRIFGGGTGSVLPPLTPQPISPFIP